jgi:phosphoribosylformimino-5-aminoimidazole carboxamide ribotide isomerase
VELFPAIDLRGGHCVRLYQGDFAREKVYGEDPTAQAEQFAAEGAPWIHVVDLDAARTGEPINRAAITALTAAVACKVQSGGGVRDAAAAQALLDAGVARVVVGTAALEDPAFVRRLADAHPGQVAVGVDARVVQAAECAGDRYEVAGHGWVKGSGLDLVDVAHRFEDAGVAALIVTEIGRDGTMEGPDVAGLAQVLEATEIDVVASGGVGSLDDLRALTALEVHGRRLAGAIVGRALYEGAFTLPEALAAAAGQG